MSSNSDAQVRHVHEQWHQTIINRDLDGLAALYAEDGIFESPAVLALTGGADGTLRGRAAIRAYFELFLQKFDKNAIQWYRTDKFFSDGTILEWEYPRQTPHGDQTDLIKSMDLKDGLIVHHRVYWGWVGLKSLLATMNK